MHQSEYLRNYFDENSIVGSFGEIEIHVKQKVEKKIDKRIKETSTGKLLYSENTAERAEFQWRICLPLSVLILIITCYFILRVEPRSGKFTNLPLAIIYYSTYYIAIGLGRSWIEQGVITNIFFIPATFVLSLLLYYSKIKRPI